MSYDINIYANELSPNPISNWMQRLNACDRMAYDLHPEVVFVVGLSGFCPIKVTMPGRWPFSSRQDYMSGFEMSVSSFDFETGDIINKQNQLEAEGIDLGLWKSFSAQVCISFNPNNMFEARLSFLTAAILTEEFDGICYDPQLGQEMKKSGVFTWAEKQVKRHDADTKSQKLVAHPFEGWR